MARPYGNRNADYDEAKLKLLRTIRDRMLLAGSGKVSFREMAECAGVTVPTLRHYFGTRTALVAEVFAELLREGERYLADARTSGRGFAVSMQQAGEALLAGARLGRLDRVHALGLTEGLWNDELGPAYLNSILEPSLQAIEARLQAHQLRGECDMASPRYAALAFVAPILLAVLHQGGLGGACARPLDLQAFLKAHVQAFVAAHGTAAPQPLRKGKNKSSRL